MKQETLVPIEDKPREDKDTYRHPKSKFMFRKTWKWTESLACLVRDKMRGFTLHVPCGSSDIGDVRVDLEPDMKPDVIGDMFMLPFREGLFDTVISDPPWNIPYNHRNQLGYRLRDMARVGGRIIFNSRWWLRVRALEDREWWIRVPDGPAFRHTDISVVVIAEKTQGQLTPFMDGVTSSRKSVTKRIAGIYKDKGVKA